MRRPTLLTALLVLALPLGAASGEEGSASAAFEAAIAQLEAPSAVHAFTFEGDATMNGEPFGSVTFQAEPTGEGDTWSVSDLFSFGGGAYVRTSSAVLDRRLQPLSGSVEGKEPGTDGFRIEWLRNEKGFEVKHTATKAGETTSSEKTLERAGILTTSMCSLWLFARATGMAKGTYAVEVFDADPKQGDPAFELATWTQGEEGSWGDRKVLLLQGAKGDDLVEAAFDPETHALVGTRLKNAAQGFEMEIRPAAPKPAEEEADLFARPARSAKEVALQAGLAFAVADLELAERVLHWPSLHAQAEARHTGEDPFLDLDAFKAATMRNLKESLTERPRPMIEGALKMVQEQLQEEAVEDGLTKVSFPPMFQNLVMTVGEIDGQWYLVRLPGAPQK